LANRRDGRRQDAGVSLSGFPRRRVRGGGVGRGPSVCLTGLLMTQSIGFDVSHLLAGSLLVLSFVLLYQDRITAVLNVFALQAIALALSVAWQALIQDAPPLLARAVIALVLKAVVIPTALHRIVRRLGIHREIEQVIGA